MKSRVLDSPAPLTGPVSSPAVEAADEMAQKQERPATKAKRAKKGKARNLPALTHNFTRDKILAAQKRLLKGLKRREERAKARVKELGSLKKHKSGGVEGS